MVGLLAAAAAGMAAPAELAKVLAYQQGVEALNDQLPELASKRLREALGQNDLSDAARAEVFVRLGEALVREGKSAEALAVLDQGALAATPEAPFWKAQALAGVGQLEAAVATFASCRAANLPYSTEACFSQASLLLALGRSDEAMATLATLGEQSGHPARAEALLRQAEIQYDLGKFPAARDLLAAVSNPAPAIAVHARYLDARLLLEENKLADAAARFSEILQAQDPAYQSLDLRHQAALGLADATAAAGDRQAAADALLVFIEKNPGTRMLDHAFERLARWIPETPLANDPILQRVRQWAGAENLTNDPLLAGNDGVLGAFPRPNERTGLTGQALVFLARQMRESNPAEAASALRRLMLDFADDPLARKALLDQATWLIEKNRAPEAAVLLGALEKNPAFGGPDGQTSFLAARAEYQAGNFQAAAKLFEAASQHLASARARTATLDAAVSRLRAGDLAALDAKLESVQSATLRGDIELEKALYLAAKSPEEAAGPLRAFIDQFPGHPRLAEAQLALAGALLEAAAPDPAQARRLLEPLDLANLAGGLRGRVVLLRMRVEELSRQWAAQIAIAQEFLAQNPASPEVPTVMLKLGEALFRNKDYNAARIAMQKLAAAHPESPLAEVALFHAARAAALGGTPQAQEESLALFDQVSAKNGPLRGQAQTRKLRTLIDLNRLDQAIQCARQTLAETPAESDLRQPLNLLLAEALFASGKPNAPKPYEEALAIYTELLGSTQLTSTLSHRLHYLRGLTLEQLNRDGEALDSYYQVLETREPGKPHSPEEWYQFERTAFKGLGLLEARGRWRAAVAFAEKIASFQGPRAREAAERAKKLRLEHMIWE